MKRQKRVLLSPRDVPRRQGKSEETSVASNSIQ